MKTDGKSGEVIRPLGYNERYELAQYTLDYNRGVSTACRYTIPQELITRADFETYLKDAVYGAIARVISDSPTLHATIRDAESKKPLWTHVTSIDLSEHVAWSKLSTSVDADDIVQDRIRLELDTRFLELGTRPGWRVVVLQHASNNVLDVVFTWNHAHTDGMGGKIFHDKFLKALVTEARGDLMTTTKDGIRLEFPMDQKCFPPATELFVDLSTSPGFLLQQAWNETKPASLFPNPSIARWAPVQKKPYKTKFGTCIVDHTTLSGVLGACRAHKTTLTALLHGLVLLSLASQLEESAARAFTNLTAIDQRRFLPSHPSKYPWLDPSSTMANYVTNTTHDFDGARVSQMRSRLSEQSNGDLSTDAFELVWSAASKVRDDIEKRLNKGLKDDRLALMKFVTDARTLFEKEARKPRTLSWALSNLGVIEGTAKAEGSLRSEQEGTWSIQRAQFTLSAHVPDAALLIAAISLRQGELVITCTWQDEVVEDGLANRLLADLKRWLTQMSTA